MTDVDPVLLKIPCGVSIAGWARSFTWFAAFADFADLLIKIFRAGYLGDELHGTNKSTATDDGGSRFNKFWLAKKLRVNGPLISRAISACT